MRATRRNFFGLGLGAGLLALLRTGAATDRLSYLKSDVYREYPLEFRLDSGYRPDLSRQAGRRLARAVLGFLEDSHPLGMTLTFWERNPREIPQLPDHVARLMDALFQAIDDNLTIYPVDPILLLSLLYNESRYMPTALSPAGAAGMAQFMPETAREYGLTPVAHEELWQRYRETEQREREARSAQVAAFLEHFAVSSFTAEAVIERTLATGTVDILRQFQALQGSESEADLARQNYVAVLRAEFAQLDFFGQDRAMLEKLDARVGYGAVAAAVAYVARRLAENRGMVTSAAAAYNAGPAAVRVSNPDSVLYDAGDLPANPETVRYVQRILVVHSALKYRVYQNA